MKTQTRAAQIHCRIDKKFHLIPKLFKRPDHKICPAAAEARGTAKSARERAQTERRGAEHSETDSEPNPRQAV